MAAHDTLYSVAWRHHLDYHDLAAWNHLGSDYRLAVGQVLILQPPSAQQASRARSAAAAGERAAPRPAPGSPTAPQAANARAPSADEAAATAVAWAWPATSTLAPRPVPGGGILLLGTLGADVRAARGGRVVYTGSGLRGYGNLIIIKHGDILLSSYAHNRDLLVREGQDVGAGQLIAHMGTGARQTPALYFEIRVRGRPVNPMRCLPTLRPAAAVPPPGAAPRRGH